MCKLLLWPILPTGCTCIILDWIFDFDEYNSHDSLQACLTDVIGQLPDNNLSRSVNFLLFMNISFFRLVDEKFSKKPRGRVVDLRGF